MAIKRDRRLKNITLFSHYEEGFGVRVVALILWNGSFESSGSLHHIYSNELAGKEDKAKRVVRTNDRSWVMHNIPSSIWWHTQNHHDWKNGGILYLLTKGEHILRHRREKNENQ